MPMTLVVTNDVPDRTRGFLASCMLELAPGVYTAPRMSAAVRRRVLEVLGSWHERLKRGSVVVTWPDAKAPGGQAIVLLGVPQKHLVVRDGIVLSHRHVGLFDTGDQPL